MIPKRFLLLKISIQKTASLAEIAIDFPKERLN